MENEDIYLAVDFGASGLRVMAAHKNGSLLEIVGEEHDKIQTRHGIVTNSDDIQAALVNSFKCMTNRINCSGISSYYAAVGGHTMRSNHVVVSRKLGGCKVTDVLLKEMHDEAMNQMSDGRYALDAVPTCYTIDTNTFDNPLGQSGGTLLVQYALITSAVNLRQKMQQINQSVGQESYLRINPMVTADIALGFEAKQQGSVFIDFGAENTSLAIYKGGKMQHLAVIPLGSAHITRDLQTVYGISEQTAEELKIKKGHAKKCDASKQFNVSARNGEDLVRVDDLDGVIEARMREILLLLKEQIRLVDMGDLPGGAMITGGGSRLSHIETLATEVLGMPIQHATFDNLLTSNNREYDKPENALLLCMLYKADKNCIKLKDAQETFSNKTSAKKQRRKFTDFIGDLFNDQNTFNN